MDDVTIKEKKVMEELRRRTINDMTPKLLEDVSVFCRFAKARDFLLGEAEAMLKKHINWRKEMQIDLILTHYEPPEVLVKYIPTIVICFDKEGSLVRHVDCGRGDPNSLWNAVTKIDLAKYIAYIIEKDKDILIKKGYNLGNPMYTFIYDFEDLSYANAINIRTVQYIIYLLKMFIDNYPEAVKRVLLINAPSYFTWLFSAIKPLIPKRILQKMTIYSTDSYKADLLEFIEAVELPAYLGGTKTDPDGNPRCETFIHRWRQVSNNYHRSKESEEINLASTVKKLTVKPLSKEIICFNVEEVNSFLEWEFETKNRDIDFFLYFKEGSSENHEPVEIISKQRIDSSDKPERGYLKCEKAGSYVIVFDNSYCWFYSKEVYYRAEIKSPKNEE